MTTHTFLQEKFLVKLQQKTKKSLISLCFLIITTFLFSDTISFKANSMAGSIGENNTSTILKGNAWIENEDLELFANEISLRGDNYDFITATGNISGRYKTSNFAFSCNSLEYDKNTGIVILKENVKIDDTENELSATASVVEYDKNLEVATMQINVVINHKNSVCTGTLGIYRKKEQILDLSGNPKIVRDSDTFTAQDISLNMKTEEISLDGKVRGSVVDKKEEKSSENQDAPEENNE